MNEWMSVCDWQVYTLSRNGQLFVFQCDTDLSDLVDTDITQRQDSSSSSDEDVEPDHPKKRKGHRLVHLYHVVKHRKHI